ncbi:MAG: hypothetical protein IJS09_00475 [Treponema sp.]|nr:hypothetical protein [Treponema sp.]
MTLKTRNTLTKYLFFASLLITAMLITLFIIAIFTQSVTPPTTLRLVHLPDTLVLTQYNFIATMITAAVLVLYVPAMLFIVLRFFENTQSVEVIFFCGVLLGCLCEGARTLIPLFGIWQSYSLLLFFVSRIIFAGRLMVPLFFFATAALSDTEQRQEVERNFFIMLALATVIATAMPMNTAQTTTTCTVIAGFSSIATVIRLLIFIITGGTFYINARKHDIPELKRITIFYSILTIGYLLLTIADNFLLMGIGTIFLVLGTLQFLRNLHRLYMWK